MNRKDRKDRKSNIQALTHPLANAKTLESLIFLEEDLLTKNATIITLQKIIKIYSDLIEYYDNLKDPIYNYFKEKIQIFLSNKEISKMLDSKNDVKEENEKFQRRSQISLNTKKELRSKMMDFNLKIKKVDDSERKKSIQEMLKNHEKQQQDITHHIKKEIQTQEDIFNQKMQRRRERSMSRSLSRSIDKSKKTKNDQKLTNAKNLLDSLTKSSKEQMDNPFENK